MTQQDTGVPGDDKVALTAAERIIPRSAAAFPPQLFVVLRVAVRAGEACAAWPLGARHPWLLVVAAVACCGWDLAVSRLSRRLTGWGLAVLVACDAGDAAAWSLGLGGGADIAVLIAAPTAGMAGLRFGPRALAVPAAVGSAVLAAAESAGRRPDWLGYLWPGVAVGVGMLVAVYLKARWRQESAIIRHEIEAAAGQAELSGQNSIAMGADSIVDLLSRTAPLLGRYESGMTPSPLAGWKAALAEQCGRASAYLGVSLARWQREYNSRSADLASDVQLRPRPGVGTLLLSPAQEVALFAALEELAPSGVVPVDVPHTNPVGQEQVVTVGGHRIVLPPDQLPRRHLVEPAPVLLGWGAALTAAHSPLDDASPAVTVPVAAVLVGLAWLVHRRPPQSSARRCGWMLAAALAVGATDALLATATAPTAVREGSPRLPFLLFLDWFAPLVVLYAPQLTAGLTVMLIVVTGAAAAGAATLLEVPFDAAAVGRALLWPLAGAAAVVGLRQLLEIDAAALHEQFAAWRREAVGEGYRQGRGLVMRLVEDALGDLGRRYERARPAMPADVAEDLARRLAQARDALAALREGGESAECAAGR